MTDLGRVPLPLQALPGHLPLATLWALEEGKPLNYQSTWPGLQGRLSVFSLNFWNDLGVFLLIFPTEVLVPCSLLPQPVFLAQ